MRLVEGEKFEVEGNPKPSAGGDRASGHHSKFEMKMKIKLEIGGVFVNVKVNVNEVSGR